MADRSIAERTEAHDKSVHVGIDLLITLQPRIPILKDGESTVYIPSSFQETDLTKLHAFMELHSFATLISYCENEPLASHLPLLVDRDAGINGRLIGHMARPNTQWQSAAEKRVLAIFHGPHAYISPSWYAAKNVVPTWNYAVVHAYGVMRLVEDAERMREVLDHTVKFYEAGQERPWSMGAPDREFIDKLLDGIVGFEINIDRLEGKWKLNQNHPAERRAKVIRELQSLGESNADEIAALMSDIQD
jgi:transcriptional regulator